MVSKKLQNLTIKLAKLAIYTSNNLFAIILSENGKIQPKKIGWCEFNRPGQILACML
jgi:hypothetical protein